MKTIGAAMQTHLDGENTTLATCWKIVRDDATIMGFTDHDVDIVFETVTYESSAGINPSNLKSTAGGAVDNLDIVSVLSSVYINDEDIVAKKYDNADIYIFMVNYKDLTMGDIKLSRGKMGEIEVRDEIYVAEFRSMTQHLHQRLGERYATKCRADLGDTRCAVTLAGFTFATTVSTVTDQANFTCGLANAAGYFDFGLLTWTSGLNIGYSMEVKAYTYPGSVATFELVEKMPYAVAVTDAFSVYAGCDKTTATCIATFNNIINFRGEPFIPGQDEVLKFGGQ